MEYQAKEMLTRLWSTNRLKSEPKKTDGASLSLLIVTAQTFFSPSSIIYLSFPFLLFFLLIFILTF